ncbi:unnamed protein product, partial [Effrenium voratum]
MQALANAPKKDLVQKELESLKPLTQCGCGCSLNFGVALILCCYLARSAYVVVAVFGDVVLQSKRFQSTKTSEAQTFDLCEALLALPFIFSGFYALRVRCDSYLRPFMYFMMVTFAVDALQMLAPVWQDGICAFVPEGLRSAGFAGACGFMRLLFAAFFGQVAAVEAYFIFAVWSLCEDMKVNMKCGLPELLHLHQKDR